MTPPHIYLHVRSGGLTYPPTPIWSFQPSALFTTPAVCMMVNQHVGVEIILSTPLPLDSPGLSQVCMQILYRSYLTVEQGVVYCKADNKQRLYTHCKVLVFQKLLSSSNLLQITKIHDLLKKAGHMK